MFEQTAFLKPGKNGSKMGGKRKIINLACIFPLTLLGDILFTIQIWRRSFVAHRPRGQKEHSVPCLRGPTGRASHTGVGGKTVKHFFKSSSQRFWNIKHSKTRINSINVFIKPNFWIIVNKNKIKKHAGVGGLHGALVSGDRWDARKKLMALVFAGKMPF